MACRMLTDDAARLACFDREAAKFASSATTAPQSTVAPALNAKQQFGLPEHAVVQKEIAEGTRPSAVNTIEARVEQLSQTSDGRNVVTLDNQQVWRQLTVDRDLLLKPGETVTISRGVLGSFWLETKQGRGTKVTRVR
jgi:D-lyxose ketol-isomerase